MSRAGSQGRTRGEDGSGPGPVVLLVEDSAADATLVQDLLEELDPSVRVVHRPDVPSACQWLRQGAPKARKRLSTRPRGEESPGGPGSADPDGGGEPSQAGPQLVLCDVRLPGPGGPELVECLRSSPRWGLLPIVMISTSGQPRDVASCRRAGANDYLVKSSDPEALIVGLRSALSLIDQ